MTVLGEYDDALLKVLTFRRQFGVDHVALALHCAVPLGLTPQLVNLMRVNFVNDLESIAESDLLLAAWCRDLGGGYFQFEAEVREFLLEELQHEPKLGRPRLERAARLILAHADHEIRQATDADSQAYYLAQQWAAIAYLDPSRAAESMAASLKAALEGESGESMLRIASIAKTLSAPLIREERFLFYSAGVEELARNNLKGANNTFEHVAALDEPVKIGSVALPAPKTLIERAKLRRTLQERRATDDERSRRRKANRQGKRLFLSHGAGDDLLLAGRLANDLRTAGFDGRSDDHIRTGRLFNEALATAIERSDCVVCLLSTSSVNSQSVHREITTALGRDMPVLFLILDANANASAYQEFAGLARYRNIDFSSWQRSYAALVAQLIESLDEIFESNTDHPQAKTEAAAPSAPEPGYQGDPNLLPELARRIVWDGPEQALHGISYARIGKLVSIDPSEIASYRSMEWLVADYVHDHDNWRGPLSIGIFGPPGSGKSFVIRQIVESVAQEPLESISFNLAQFRSIDNLAEAFKQIIDSRAQGKLPLVLWDEFDASLGSNRLGWLQYFLAAMDDGTFRHGDVQLFTARPSIFVFSGGVQASYNDFVSWDDSTFYSAKGPDFVSRLRGYLDVPGIDPAGPADRYFIIRRARAIRLQLERLGLIRPDGPALAKITEPVLNALLDVRRYKYGVRSIEAIIAMCRADPLLGLTPDSLPSAAQLEIHVNAEEFLKLAYESLGDRNHSRKMTEEESDLIVRRALRLTNHGASIPETVSRLARKCGRSPDFILGYIKRVDVMQPGLALVLEPDGAIWTILRKRPKESDSNYAERMATVLSAANCEVTPLPWRPLRIPLTRREIDILAESQYVHWQANPPEWWLKNQDQVYRSSPNWIHLPADFKNRIRAAVAEIPESLAKIAYTIRRRNDPSTSGAKSPSKTPMKSPKKSVATKPPSQKEAKPSKKPTSKSRRWAKQTAKKPVSKKTRTSKKSIAKRPTIRKSRKRKK